MSKPDLSSVKEYLGDAVRGKSDALLGSVLAAEAAAQARVCRVDEANYPADLAEALCRRVAANLARRSLPLGIQDAELGGTRVGADPEVRRLEAPHRRLVVG